MEGRDAYKAKVKLKYLIKRSRVICKSICVMVYWLTIMNKMVYEYNVAIQSATNKSLFNLFMGQTGFNSVARPLDESSSNQDEGLIKFEIINDEKEIKPGKITINKKYLAHTDKKCVHNSVYNFNISNYVFIKKEFNNIAKPKKCTRVFLLTTCKNC